ncbi:MAG: Mrp/NBP35 family ATP-binding protein, partial [Oscillibacter sp.]|nr:Mrp/NBP35 family ATP-binding protein [Oscillibacter sp.]
MSECTHDCASCGESCGERQEPQSLLKEHHPAARVGKVYGVVSGKGGVGKSMTCCQLAVTMRRRGHAVGVLDADVTGPSIPKAFGLHGQAVGSEEGLLPMETRTGIQVMSTNLLLQNETDPVIWRGPVISGVVQQFWTDVLWNCDYLFVDMPPGTGDVSLSVFQSIPLDGILVVASPQELVSMVVEKAVKM